MAKSALTPKRKRFCELYVLHGNATKAAIEAGYSEKTARSIAAEMRAIPEVQAHIDLLIAEQSQRTGIDADSVLKEIAKIAFANMGDFMKFDEAGNLSGLSVDGLSDDQLAAITDFSTDVVIEFPDGKDGDAVYVRKTRLKLGNKGTALRDLGNHLGLFKKAEGDDMAKLLRDLVSDKALPPGSLN